MGYHLREIEKGKVGELSKVVEEVEEALDAEEQGVKIMILLELSDVVGAIEAYLEKNFPDICLIDLVEMSNRTRSAFDDGER